MSKSKLAAVQTLPGDTLRTIQITAGLVLLAACATVAADQKPLMLECQYYEQCVGGRCFRSQETVKFSIDFEGKTVYFFNAKHPAQISEHEISFDSSVDYHLTINRDTGALLAHSALGDSRGTCPAFQRKF